jgi:hypothetical protein
MNTDSLSESTNVVVFGTVNVLVPVGNVNVSNVVQFFFNSIIIVVLATSLCNIIFASDNVSKTYGAGNSTDRYASAAENNQLYDGYIHHVINVHESR